MKKFFFFILIVIIILFLFRFKTISSQEIPIEVKINDKVGFDLDKDKLSFGTIMPGGSGVRSILIKNNGEKEVYTKFKVYGDIKKWIILPKEESISLGEEKEFDFAIKVPDNVKIGEYNGILKIIILKKII